MNDVEWWVRGPHLPPVYSAGSWEGRESISQPPLVASLTRPAYVHNRVPQLHGRTKNTCKEGSMFAHTVSVKPTANNVLDWTVSRPPTHRARPSAHRNEEQDMESSSRAFAHQALRYPRSHVELQLHSGMGMGVGGCGRGQQLNQGSWTAWMDTMAHARAGPSTHTHTHGQGTPAHGRGHVATYRTVSAHMATHARPHTHYLRTSATPPAPSTPAPIYLPAGAAHGQHPYPALPTCLPAAAQSGCGRSRLRPRPGPRTCWLGEARKPWGEGP